MNMNDIKEEVNLRNINVADVWKEKNLVSVKYQKIMISISVIYTNISSESFWAGNSNLKQTLKD